MERQAWAKRVDPDQMPHSAASDEGLHYLQLIQLFLDTSTGITID